MDEDPSVPEDERAVELSSVAAIYPEIIIDSRSPFKASLSLPVSPAIPLKVHFQQHLDSAPLAFLPTPPTSLDSGDADGSGKDGKIPEANVGDREIYYLSHLPPLMLEIELPVGYPSDKPPHFNLCTQPAWLPKSNILKLLDGGKKLWEECGKGLVVYSYIDYLQQSADDVFGSSQNPEVAITLSWDLKIALLDFDIKTKREKFEQETFECGVCLEPKKGFNCHRLLLCSHVFCIPCLQDFYHSCIKEGDVTNVKCLDPDCGKGPKPTAAGEQDGVSRRMKRSKKQDRTLNPSELLQIPLEQEVVQRYVHLKRKKKLESDKTTVYCPRQWCQGAARSKRYPKPTGLVNDDPDVSSDEENDAPTPFDPLGDEDQLPPMSERLAVCEDCSYAFCCVCRKGWHGELVRCFPRRAAELSAEEKASEVYIDTYTSPCPTCNARCQKSMGCNHMICSKCSTHFCYLCSSWLSESNPYAHFNDPKGNCYMRLWELENGDDADGAPEWDIDSEVDREELVFDGPNEDSSGEEDDGPEWEFAGESDEENPNLIGHNHPPPPPAPVPPRAMHPANPADLHLHADVNIPDEAVRAAAAERQAQADAIARARNRRPLGRGPFDAPNRPDRNRAALAPHRIAGLQRFLNLVQNDQEDEWDSDELGNEF